MMTAIKNKITVLALITMLSHYPTSFCSIFDSLNYRFVGLFHNPSFTRVKPYVLPTFKMSTMFTVLMLARLTPYGSVISCLAISCLYNDGALNNFMNRMLTKQDDLSKQQQQTDVRVQEVQSTLNAQGVKIDENEKKRQQDAQRMLREQQESNKMQRAMAAMQNQQGEVLEAHGQTLEHIDKRQDEMQRQLIENEKRRQQDAENLFREQEEIKKRLLAQGVQLTQTQSMIGSVTAAQEDNARENREEFRKLNNQTSELVDRYATLEFLLKETKQELEEKFDNGCKSTQAAISSASDRTVKQIAEILKPGSVTTAFPLPESEKKESDKKGVRVAGIYFGGVGVGRKVSKNMHTSPLSGQEAIPEDKS